MTLRELTLITHPPRNRVLLILPTASYRAFGFVEAAKRLSLDLAIVSEEKNVLESRNPAGYLNLDFKDLAAAIKKVTVFAKTYPIDALLGLDDQTLVLASALAQALSLPHNPIESVRACANKRLMREKLKAAGIPSPQFLAFGINENPESAARQASFPCVLKPVNLAASQGVIRANNLQEFMSTWPRVKKIIEIQRAEPEILVESYIEGAEVALEGLLDNGHLRVLTIFDKPDPLEGPFFEETIYVRPSRLSGTAQKKISDCVQRVVTALGLKMGPIHAEVRVNAQGAWLLEIAARPIGGRCSRVLKFSLGVSLEEVVLLSSLGAKSPPLEIDPTPSGVIMIPIPQAGILKEVRGIKEARSVDGIEDIIISAVRGQRLVPLPEGSAYLGFIFARGSTPEFVISALRHAHRCPEFEILSA